MIGFMAKMVIILNYKQIGKDGDFFYFCFNKSSFLVVQLLKNNWFYWRGFLPANTTILEIGAHHGYLLADIIQFIYTLKPKLLETLNFAIVERFQNLQEQKKIYKWLFWRYYKIKTL